MKKSKRLNRHHRKQRKDGGTDNPSNLVSVPVNLHRFYHAFFVEGTYPPDMARKLNDWIDEDFKMVAIPTKDVRRVLKIISELN